MKKIVISLAVVLLLSFWAIKPLFHEYMYHIHDDDQVVRVAQMAKALSDGQFPVRWTPDLGYGYGDLIFNFYSPLPYYVGAVFNLAGVEILKATQIMFIIGILLSSITMYFFAREFWGERGGIFSAMLYLYAPYHAVDIYVRGALAEIWGIGLLPLPFLAVYKVMRTPSYRWFVIGSLSYAALLLSHNITAFVASPLLVLYSLYLLFAYKLQRKTIAYAFAILGGGLLLSAFFWLPALKEQHLIGTWAFTKGSTDYALHFVCPEQLWSSPWAFGTSVPGCTDYMSLKIGKFHLLFAGVAGFLFLIFRKKNKQTTILPFFLGLLLLSIFMTLEWSKFLWDTITPLALVQFPWRYLIFITFAAGFVGGAWFLLITNKKPWLQSTVLVVCFILVVFNARLLPLRWEAKYFVADFYLTAKGIDYLTQENIKWRVSSYTREYIPKTLVQPLEQAGIVRKKLVPSKTVTLSQIDIQSTKHTFKTSSETGGTVIDNTAYFPGWKVFIDRKEVTIKKPQGKIHINIPQGTHEVIVIFTNTPIRTLANTLSLLALGSLIIGGVLTKKKIAQPPATVSAVKNKKKKLRKPTK